MKRVNLPDYYLITPNLDDNLSGYLTKLKYSILNHQVTLLQLRSKNLSLPDYHLLAKRVVSITKDYQVKLILNPPMEIPVNNINHWVDQLKADGFHYPSKTLIKQGQRILHGNKILSVACHNMLQLQHAERISADLAVLSPVVFTPSSPDKVPLGWHKFAALVNQVKIPVYALGGMTIADSEIAKQFGAQGIAAKRGLWL